MKVYNLEIFAFQFVMFCLGQVGFCQAPGMHQLQLKERAIETMMKMTIDHGDDHNCRDDQVDIMMTTILLVTTMMITNNLLLQPTTSDDRESRVNAA